MKKRLRKKLHLGEFREFCFEISFETEASLSDNDRDVLLDSFIAMIEQNRLQVGVGGLHEWSGMVQLNRRSTEQHRQLVADWLDEHPHVHKVQVGELVDAWHGWD